MNIPEVPFSHTNISDHVKILASDEFEGRAPGSDGERKTITYVSEQFSKLGLAPRGDLGRWTQLVPLRKIELDKPTLLRAKGRGKTIELSAPDDLVIGSFARNRRVNVTNSPVVFVGYGISAPDLGWDDFKEFDLKGKVAVFLVNDPGFESVDPDVISKFCGKEMTLYGRWTYKIEEAVRRGAVAAIVVHEDAAATYGWTTVRNSFSVPQFDLAEPGIVHARPQIFGFISWTAAKHLFGCAGFDLEEAKRRAGAPNFSPFELTGLVLDAQAELNITRLNSANVVACIPGDAQPDECIVYCGHWDHLGIGRPDESGDSICHGALDNATAIAGLIELARVYSTEPRTRRSIYFIAFTAEEKGLLGSEYYVSRPACQLANTAAVFNMELLGIGGPMRDIGTWGSVRSSLHDALKRAAAADGRSVLLDDHLEAGYYFRSDHLPFAKRGVPGITISSGRNLYDGGRVAGHLAYVDYINRCYHQPADRWSSQLDFRGVALDLNVIYRAGREISESTSWPEWNERSEFKGIRRDRRNR